MNNKNESISVSCPECNYEKKLTISEIERNSTYTCAKCKNNITIDSRGFKNTMKDLDKLFK